MKFKKRIIAVAITVAMLGVILYINPLKYFTEDTGKAAAAGSSSYQVYNASGDIIVPDGDVTAEAMNDRLTNATADNPHVVLEIVPDLSMAEVGYMVDGFEPIDTEKMEFVYEADGYSKVFTFPDNLLKCVRTQILAFEPDAQEIIDKEWVKPYGTKERYVSYTRVEDGTGYYSQVLVEGTFVKNDEGKGDYELASEYASTAEDDVEIEMLVYTPDGDGDYDVTSVTKATFDKVGENRGNFNRTYADEYVDDPDRPAELTVSSELYADVIGTEVTVIENSEYYQSFRNVFTNQNAYAKYCLDLDEATLERYIAEGAIVVITVTPTELNKHVENVRNANSGKTEGAADWTYDIIDRADIIFISSKSHRSSYVDYWKDYRKENLFPDSVVAQSGNKYSTYQNNDINWETTLKLFEKCGTSAAACPVVFDIYAYDHTYNIKSVNVVQKYADGSKEYFNGATGRINNFAKLYLMLHVMEPSMFEAIYLDSDSPIITETTVTLNGKTITTGSVSEQTGDAMTYWCYQTFFPLGLYNNRNEYVTDNSGGVALESFDVLTNWGAVGSGSINQAVRHNTLSFNSDNTVTTTFTDESMSYVEHIRDEDAYDIEYENNPEANADASKLSAAEAIHYLLNAGRTNWEAELGDISILEIEPSAKFKVESYWKYYILSKFPGYDGEITIEQQNSAEFIGRVEDLNETYDIIYIGGNTGLNDYTRTFSGTVYTYVHTGTGVVTDFDGKAYGHLGETSNNTYRTKYYSGNDFTKAKYTELINFAESGKLVLIGDDLFNGSNIASNMDRNSYVYKFIKTIGAAKSTVSSTYPASYRMSNASAYEVYKSLSNTLCQIDYETGGLPVDYREAGNYDDQTFEYRIKIRGNGSSRYSVTMYADMNADGTYDPTTEKFDATSIIDAAGNSVSASSLKPDQWYKIKVEIADRVGIFPWKLLVSSNTDNTKDSVLGMSAIKATTKEVINVLQITSDVGNNVQLPTVSECSSWETAYSSQLRGVKEVDELDEFAVDELGSNVSKMFWLYTRDLSEFDVETVRMSGKEFNAMISATATTLKTNDPSLAEEANRDKFIKKLLNEALGSYDMIIVGFADDYKYGFSTADALEVIGAYIDSGASILFTHDTTTFTLLQDAFWKQSVYFRNVLGLDRYGCSLKYNVDITEISGTTSVAELDVKHLGTSYSELTGEHKKDAILELSTGSGNNDSGTTNTYKTKGVVQLQGYTNGLINRYYKGVGNNITTKVSKVNTGQITNYPYFIKDEIPVSPTHSQYYQTDLEDDDLVVWYTLAYDDSTSSRKTTSKEFKEEPHDTRNYYYIYNNENITYSGVGHSGTLTPEEVKLFVNTIIAAYRGNAANPRANLENDGSVNIGDYSYAYVPYDATNVSEAIGNDIITKEDGKTYLRMYFTLRSNAIVSDRKFFLNFYCTPDTGGFTADEKYLAYFGSSAQPTVYRKSDNKIAVEDPTGMGSGYCKLEGITTNATPTDSQIYYVDVCINDGAVTESSSDAAKDASPYLAWHDEQDFIITVYMYYNGLDREYAKESDQYISILRRGLFELD